MNEKRCTKCGEIKPITEFYRERRYNSWQSQCKQCKAKRQAAFNAAHRKEIAEYNAKYCATHQKENSERKKTYYDTHRDELLVKNAKWRAEHPQKMAAYKASYAAKNREKVKASQIKYVKAHPEKPRFIQHRRRARKYSLPVSFTDADWTHALKYFNGTCAYCGNPPSLFDNNGILHADHFIPLSSSKCPGTISTNMVPACQDCNLSKNRRDPHKWIASRFGKRKASQIEKRIQTYFASLSTGDNDAVA